MHSVAKSGLWIEKSISDIMKKFLNLILIAGICLTAASCSSSIVKRMQAEENVVSTCTPSPLIVKAGQVPAQLAVSFPKGYFAPKAIVEVTPVLVYEGGEAKGPVFTYQGEKVKDNYKVVAKTGTEVREKVSFSYIDAMKKSTLELRGKLIYNGKEYELPTRKVAEGCITTGIDAVAGLDYAYKADGYQAIIAQSTEGQIMYDVNSATVKNSELKSKSIKRMQEELEELKNNERVTVTGTQIISYASPEGGQELNAKLSDNRAETAEKAWKKLDTGVDASAPEIKSVGQDWEGFREAVTKSDIQDKDLILRVLSMYSDPAVRESEIKNISQIFTELKKEVFPELRRARFITNSEFKNYSDQELKELAKTSADKLTEPALLHLATLSDNLDVKAAFYEAAIEKYDSQTGLYNLACTYLEEGQAGKAETCLENIDNQNDADVINALGVAKMLKGDIDGANALFVKANNIANQGTVDIVKGNYSEAVAKLEGTSSKNKGVAYLLAGDYASAKNELTGDDAQTEYYLAIIAAREGKASQVKSHLNSAFEKDPALREKAAKDIEFAKYL